MKNKKPWSAAHEKKYSMLYQGSKKKTTHLIISNF